MIHDVISPILLVDVDYAHFTLARFLVRLLRELGSETDDRAARGRERK
jgi:hypothetical protein